MLLACPLALAYPFTLAVGARSISLPMPFEVMRSLAGGVPSGAPSAVEVKT